jgi:para-aminobenzoate synthetase / 4-amino-4-deoxychorismate lyase
MTTPRVLLHFPPDTGLHGVALEPLREVIVARSLDEVAPALHHIHRAARDGAYAAGFVSYEAAPAFDPAFRVRGGGRLPLLWFGIFEGLRPAAEPATTPGHLPVWSPDTARDAYDRAVADIRNAIRNGDVYQVNHTFRLRGPFTGEVEPVYHRLRRAQQTGWFAFIDLGDHTVVSVSPELFFATTGSGIRARPMKGTAPRGRHPAEDAAAARRLRASSKDRAENLMIVDLLRNDLGRVCETGSIRVPRLFEVERYPTVWQMTSTIEGTLRDGIALPDIFAALFPCGSVTGAPKVAATRVIATLEPSPREVYCGALGVVAPGGDATFNVAIRTLWVDHGTGIAEYGVGGGVTWDSTARGEYDEALTKAAMLELDTPEFDLLETMRLEGGCYRRLDEHLGRLQRSAAFFGRPFDADATRVALADHASRNAGHDERVRLRVDERGRASVESEPLERSAAPRRVALAGEPVRRSDRFLYHKTTRREVYERRRAARPDVDDVILFNEDGELTELTTGNLVVELDGALVTPALDAALLAGVFRAQLLREGHVREAALRPADLQRATRLWLVNSVREWAELELVP